MNALTRSSSRPPRRYKTLGISPDMNGSGDAGDSKVDFSNIWSTVQRGKWIILLVCLLVVGAVTAYTLTMPRIYESSAIVSVGASPAMQTAGVWPAGEGIELSKEIGLLQNSGRLSRLTVERLAAIADTSAEQFTIFDPVEGEAPTTRDVILRLRERIAFEGLQAEAMIRIQASSEIPAEATLIANTYAQEYRQFSQDLARSGVTAAREFLETQVAKRQQTISEIEREWEAFALTNNVATDGEEGQRVAREFVELEGRRAGLQFQLEQEQRMKQVLERQLEELQPGLREAVLAEQNAQGLRTQIQTLEEELARLQLRAGQYYSNNPALRGNEDRAPDLAEIKRLIDSYQQQKADLTEDLVALTERQGRVALDAGAVGTTALGQIGAIQERIEERALTIRELEGQIQGLDRQIATFRGRIATIPQQTVRREQIQRRLEQAEEFHRDISAQLQETVVAEESELGYVSVVRAAAVPTLPVSPDLNQNIILGVLLGLGFGTGVAFLVQSTNSRLHAPEDLQGRGYNLLGVVPKMDAEIDSGFDGAETVTVKGRNLSTTLLPLLNPWSTVTENYRLMRANLQYPGASGEADATPPQMIMVTSPEPGDGKTTTATNLAITFALSGKKTLLIDADLRQPKAHTLLDLNLTPGLADVLRGRHTMQEVTQPFMEELSFMDNLSFISAGETNVPPTEMLDASEMEAFCAEARENYDVILVDTPPVLAASDPLLLAVRCDATLVVAHAGKTDRRALDRAEKMFEAVGVPLSSIVFNRFNNRVGHYEYGYGDGYYGYHPKLTAGNGKA